MLPNLETIHRPTTPAGAARLLKKAGEGGAILAGGTSLVLSGRSSLRELVDLSRCGLDRIRLSGRKLRIGAMVRMADLEASDLARDLLGGLLTEAAGQVGSTLTRNRVTLGGNICQLFPWCHMPVALTALDAEILLQGAGQRSVSADAFFSGSPRKILGMSGIVREVAVPVRRDRRGAFRRFARTSTDRALVSVAVAFRIRGKKMKDVRAVAGALAPRPQRVAEAERFLEGEKPDAPTFEKLADLDLTSLTFASDMRASGEYKERLVRVLLARAFKEANGAIRRGAVLD